MTSVGLRENLNTDVEAAVNSMIWKPVATCLRTTILILILFYDFPCKISDDKIFFTAQPQSSS